MFNAAIRLIAQQGCSRTTLAQIGKEAGYSRGLAAARFGTKSALFRALIARLQEQFFSEVVNRAVDGHRGLGAILATADAYLSAQEEAIGSASACAWQKLMMDAGGADDEDVRHDFQQANQRFRDRVAAWVEEAKEDGAIPGCVDSGAFAAFFVGTLRGITHQIQVDRDELDVTWLRQWTQIFLTQALGAGEGALEKHSRRQASGKL